MRVLIAFRSESLILFFYSAASSANSSCHKLSTLFVHYIYMHVRCSYSTNECSQSALLPIRHYIVLCVRATYFYFLFFFCLFEIWIHAFLPAVYGAAIGQVLLSTRLSFLGLPSRLRRANRRHHRNYSRLCPLFCFPYFYSSVANWLLFYVRVPFFFVVVHIFALFLRVFFFQFSLMLFRVGHPLYSQTLQILAGAKKENTHRMWWSVAVDCMSKENYLLNKGNGRESRQKSDHVLLFS